MSFGDLFLLTVRWLHSLSAVAWIGGSIFYLLVLRPALRSAHVDEPSFSRAIVTNFRSLVTLCIWTSLITGAILLFDRLTDGFLGSAYLAAVGTKISLALVIFAIVWARYQRTQAYPKKLSAEHSHHRLASRLTGGGAILFLGILVLLLADLLRFLVERDLARG